MLRTNESWKNPGFFDRFRPEGKPKRYQRGLTVLTFGMLLLSAIALGFMCLYFSSGNDKWDLWKFWMQTPLVVLLNILPFVLLVFLIWVFTNRAWIGFLGGGMVCLAYSWAEYWKLSGRSDAVYAEDLTLLGEALKIGGEGYIVFTKWIVLSAVLVVLGTVFFALFFRGKLPRLWIRGILAVILLAASGLCYRFVYLDQRLYQSFPVRGNTWISLNQYISRGGIYPFIHSIPSAIPSAPEGYRAKDAQAILAQYETDPIASDKQVSVICVMFEAFTDFSEYTDRITGADPYADFHALQGESYRGHLLTNIFVGGTIDTERCALTGYSSLSSFRHACWSYARYFAEQGYALNGSHPGYDTFYNRVNTNRNMGFDEYYFKENHYGNLADGIARDEVLLPEIIKICQAQIEGGNHVFSYNVTYQNHGPYSGEVRVSDVDYVPQGDLSDSDYLIVNNYLAGIADTGKQMAAMADALRDSPEPILLVFFGDHKPWLGEQSVTYEALGIDVTSGSEESIYNTYQTEYLIWANNTARETLGDRFVGMGPTISPCFLMNVLFAQCGWEGPAFQKMTNEMMALTPVVTTKGYYLYDDQLVRWGDLPEDAKERITAVRQVQYYLEHDDRLYAAAEGS